MASRILHLAVAEEIMKRVTIHDRNRFRLGSILPDAYSPGRSKSDSHWKVFVCGNSKRTYDLDRFISLFGNEMRVDGLYTGYYLHLIQDLVFRGFIYGKYKWDPTVPGNVEHLHRDYHLVNLYAIKKYGITNDIQMVHDVGAEKLFSSCPFEVENFLYDLKKDFCDTCEGDIHFFTKAMADEFVTEAADACIRELYALAEGRHYIDAYEHAWYHKPVSLLGTTQNTRDLGGYRTQNGMLTKEGSILRSDVQNFPEEGDFEYLMTRGITTIIDMRVQRDVDRKPSGFAGKKGFAYYNLQISEGSGVQRQQKQFRKDIWIL